MSNDPIVKLINVDPFYLAALDRFTGKRKELLDNTPKNLEEATLNQAQIKSD